MPSRGHFKRNCPLPQTHGALTCWPMAHGNLARMAGEAPWHRQESTGDVPGSPGPLLQGPPSKAGRRGSGQVTSPHGPGPRKESGRDQFRRPLLPNTSNAGHDSLCNLGRDLLSVPSPYMFPSQPEALYLPFSSPSPRQVHLPLTWPSQARSFHFLLSL